MGGLFASNWQNRQILARPSSLKLTINPEPVKSLCLLPQSSSKNIPPLHVEPAVIDLGEISESIHTTSFELRNVSRKPVSILHATGGCACMEIFFSETLLPPGQSIEITCVLNANGKKGDFRLPIIIEYTPQDILKINENTIIKSNCVFADITGTVTPVPKM